MQLADAIEAAIKPAALGVIIRARHLCCGWRGVRDNTEMVSSEMRGLFREFPAARAELLALIGQGVACR